MNKKIYFYEKIIKSNFYFLFLYLFFQVIIYHYITDKNYHIENILQWNDGYMEK